MVAYYRWFLFEDKNLFGNDGRQSPWRIKQLSFAYTYYRIEQHSQIHTFESVAERTCFIQYDLLLTVWPDFKLSEIQRRR